MYMTVTEYKDRDKGIYKKLQSVCLLVHLLTIDCQLNFTLMIERTCTQAHTQTHTHKHTHIQTHTHTQTRTYN